MFAKEICTAPSQIAINEIIILNFLDINLVNITFANKSNYIAGQSQTPNF